MSRLSLLHSCLLGGAICVAATNTAPAQCANSWLPMGFPGANATVQAAVMWDSDGAGPAPSLLVIAGGFTRAGDVDANRIAAWNPATGAWSAFGSGLDGLANALAVLPNGDLVVGGDFTTAGGTSAFRMARWSSGAWSAMGTAGFGMNAAVHALLTMPNGDLMAGGAFTNIAGMAANRIARWNGTTWSTLGFGINSGGASDAVRAMTLLANGDLVVGGQFTTAGSFPANRVARWDGTAWWPLGTGMNSQVLALRTLSNGDVVAGGNFTTADGASAVRLARWNGSAWSPMGTGASGGVQALTLAANGDLVAGGAFTTINGVAASRIARWDGTAWSALGSGLDGGVLCLTTLPGGELLAGGGFLKAGGLGANNVATWNGIAWSSIGGQGANGGVRCLARAAGGDVFAGGSFTTIGGVSATRVARWDGTSWSALGNGVGFTTTVRAVAAMANGDVVVSQETGGADTVLRRWDGSTWTQLSSVVGFMTALAELPNGDLLAGGADFAAGTLARWDGTSWTYPAAADASIRALVRLSNGDVLVGGDFTTIAGVAANGIARWDGTAWYALGAGVGGTVHALLIAANGDLIVGGNFSTAGGAAAERIARWNGSTWAALGSGLPNGPVFALTELPDGDILAAGQFHSVLNQIARWNGTSWSNLGSGVLWNGNPSNVEALALSSNGDLLAGGAAISSVDGVASSFLGRMTTSCPATASSSGLGCPSSGGSNTLAADTLPWVDATFRATGTGLPSTALVLTLTSVTSFAQGLLPLTLAFSQAGPGCDVLVAPDILGLLVTSTGSVQSSFFLPNTPPLVGVTFYHQMVPIELDMVGAWVAVTATNALQLVAGMF